MGFVGSNAVTFEDDEALACGGREGVGSCPICCSFCMDGDISGTGSLGGGMSAGSGAVLGFFLRRGLAGFFAAVVFGGWGCGCSVCCGSSCYYFKK